jgi:insecticidal toxin complex protein TccC
LQRWINPDPAGYVDGMNLYAFVASDPINNVDLFGLDKKRWQHLVYKHLLMHPVQSNGLRPEYRNEHLLDSPRQTEDSTQFRGVKYFNQQQRLDYNLFHAISSGFLIDTYGGVAHHFSDAETEDVTVSSNWLDDEGRVGYVLAINEYNEPELAIFAPVLNSVHHSSPFSGRPVLDAGMMSISGGGIAFIENNSGHYQPGIEQKLHTLAFLKKGG